LFKTQTIESLKQIANCLTNPSFEISGKIKDVQSLLHTDAWPLAVPNGLIVQDEDQAKLRAKSILYSYDIAQSTNKQSLLEAAPIKFLDYGCGGGYVTLAAIEAGIDAYGYDITKQWADGLPQLSDDYQLIKTNAPFTHILLYDVIDHVDHSQAVQIFDNLKELSDSNTQILVRTHPWTSRHGAHTYYKLNKAYAHLFISDEELDQYTDHKISKVMRPMKYYKDLFTGAGLESISTDVYKKPLEQFFLIEEINAILRDKLEARSEWLDSVLPIEFIDYKLIKSS
jgi:2-polyprenyl-3-methyl-5-hydroxy-6-metoxy-1,4-benzoquinol methylase